MSLRPLSFSLRSFPSPTDDSTASDSGGGQLRGDGYEGAIGGASTSHVADPLAPANVKGQRIQDPDPFTLYVKSQIKAAACLFLQRFKAGQADMLMFGVPNTLITIDGGPKVALWFLQEIKKQNGDEWPKGLVLDFRWAVDDAFQPALDKITARLKTSGDSTQDTQNQEQVWLDLVSGEWRKAVPLSEKDQERFKWEPQLSALGGDVVHLTETEDQRIKTTHLSGSPLRDMHTATQTLTQVELLVYLANENFNNVAIDHIDFHDRTSRAELMAGRDDVEGVYLLNNFFVDPKGAPYRIDDSVAGISAATELQNKGYKPFTVLIEPAPIFTSIPVPNVDAYDAIVKFYLPPTLGPEEPSSEEDCEKN